jgi:hypothetical protein
MGRLPKRTVMRSVVVAALVIASSVSAQLPFGHATPIAGFKPSLFSESVWLGNTAFGWQIEGGPPGGAAYLALSAQRQDFVASGLQVYVDPGAIVLTQLGTLDAVGKASFPFPLGGPEVPTLAGIQAYGQAAVSAPASPGLGATQGLLLELSLHPMLAWASGVESLVLVDLVTGAVVPVPGLPTGASIRAMTFGNGGRDLFVATDGGVLVVDTLAPAPAAVLLAPGVCTSLAWDRVHRRLYVLRSTNNLTVFEGDRASPLFGSIITSLSSNHQSLSISADGKVLALSNWVSGTVARRNTDPASPSYLQAIWGTTPPWMFTGNGFWTGAIHLSPDARVVSIPEYSFTQSAAMHRFDTVLAGWIDHAPGVPGIQPLSDATYGGVPTYFGVMHPIVGSWMFLTGGSGSITRLGLSLSAPAALTTVPHSASYLSSPSQYVSVDPIGRFLLRTDYLGGSPGLISLSLVEIETGFMTPLGTVPFLGYYYGIVAWR